jgi:hypothetical protein
VRNIFVSVGIRARKSTISLYRLQWANAKRRTPQLRARSNETAKTAMLRSARFGL